MLVEHLSRYEVLSMALWVYRGKIDFMWYVRKGSVGCIGEAGGPGGRCAGYFCQNDLLSHHVLRGAFWCVFAVDAVDGIDGVER